MDVVTKSSTTKPKTKPAQSRNPARYLFWGAAAFFVLWLGLKGWAIGRAAFSLQSRQAEAEALLANGLTGLDPDAVEALVLGVRRDVVVLQRETAVFMPLMPYLGWVPRLGPTLVAAPALLQMADAGTETAVYALQGFKPALALLQTDKSITELLPDLLPLIDNARPELTAMSQGLEKIAAARTSLGDTSDLPWRLCTLLELADEWLPVAQDGLKLAPHLPQIMGSDAPRHYLILAQNQDELRATGGFISGVGLVTVDNGRIGDLTFADANSVDNWQEKPYDFPPQPLYDHMGLELFLFRDANFWPDFPTSAEKAMALYSYGQDVPLPDGVIAVDQRFLQLLVEATGPITTSGSNLVITADNVINYLQESWALQDGQDLSEWIGSRKGFIGTFAQAIRAKIETDFATVDPLVLAQNMMQALETKHLLVYMRDPAVAPVLNGLGWDGRLPLFPASDFLMVVDTNMGYSKVNGLINRQLNYDVQIHNDNTINANLIINYRHQGSPTSEPCHQGTAYRPENVSSYQVLVDTCYWNYARVYTPANSQLIESSRHIVPGPMLTSNKTWNNTAQAVTDLNGLTTFSNFLIVAQGEEVNSYFNYRLPQSVIQTSGGHKQYRLDLRKQAGSNVVPVQIHVTLPERANLIAVQPQPTAINGTSIYFAFELVKDTVIIIDFEDIIK